MSVLRFPYTDLHTLNLDWIIEQLNKEGAVLSVNDKHGIVVLTGEDIQRNTTTSETVAQALTSQGTAIQTVRTQIGTYPLPTVAQSLTGAIAENAGKIANLQDDVIGSTPLPTTAKTLTGAIAENAGEIANQQDLIGSTALPTTEQTITGAINEHETDITSLNTQLADIGAIVFSENNSNSFSTPSGTITEVASVELSKGKWIVVGCIDWEANSSGYRQLSIGSATNPGRQHGCTTLPTSSPKQTYQQLTKLISTNGETITFYALQDSGSTLMAYPYAYAMKVNN